MYSDPDGHFVITTSVILWAAIIGFAAGSVIGGVAGGVTAAATGDGVGLDILFGALGGGLMGAGAGVGAVFIAPVIAGGSVVVAGQTLATGAAWGIGLGVGFASGAIGGGAQDFFNQLGNKNWDISRVDFAQVGWSSLENGVFNSLSTLLGGFGGTDLTKPMSLLLGMQLNTIPSGYTSVSDIIRWYLRRRNTYES